MDALQIVIIAILVLWSSRFVWAVWKKRDSVVVREEKTIEDVEKSIRGLKVNVGAEGLLVIQQHEGERFIQFSKYREADVDYLHFSLPILDWSEAAIPEIEQLCKTYAIEHGIQAVDGPFIEEFLDAEFAFNDQETIDNIFIFSKAAMGALGVSLDERFEIEFTGDTDLRHTIESLNKNLKSESKWTLTYWVGRWMVNVLEKEQKNHGA